MLWQYFETDDEEFYKTKVCFILNNDVSEMDLVFAEEKYSKSGHLEKVVIINSMKNEYKNEICLFYSWSKIWSHS